jgi:predicted alpha/beta-fold hydrolase
MVDQDVLGDAVTRLPTFIPKFPWFGGDLQTLRNALLPPRMTLDIWPRTSLRFDMADGTGDSLIGELQQPDTVDRHLPLVILIHGLTGSMDSTYMRVSAYHLLRAGYSVLRLTLRGAGSSRRQTQGFYHAGRSEDLHQVIGQLDGRLAGNGLVLVGFSVGGNMMLKYLAERGRLAPIQAAISVSAPIDLAVTQQRLASRRNRRYHDFLLGEMKAERPCPADITSIIDFDNRVVAPSNGFADAADYYRQSSAKPMLGRIKRPTLLIHAANDPWIPASIYSDIDLAGNRRLRLLLPRSGGHVGFHAWGLEQPWHDLAIEQFIRAALAG